MKTSALSLPEIAVIAGTRGLLGAGLALLLGHHLEPEHRRTVGWTLVAIGVITTLPLVVDVLVKQKEDVSEAVE